MACVDGLIGLPEALETVFPHTQVQLCLVWCIRCGSPCVMSSGKSGRRWPGIYGRSGAPTLSEAEGALEHFLATWDVKYPFISASWRRDWERLTVFFGYPQAMRKVIYTTNAIESLNYSLCKVFKGRGAFPTDEAILKVLYLGMQRLAEKWTTPIPEWKRALNQFALLLGDRVPTA